MRPIRHAVVHPLENRVLLSVAAGNLEKPSFQLFHHPGEVVASSSTPQGGITPSQMLQAYGINSIQFGSVAGNGAGQTIAIIDAYHDPNAASDLANFDSFYGLAQPPSFTQLDENGGTNFPSNAPTDGWGIEESLDIEWAHVIAPAANMILYDADSTSDSDLIQTAVVTAENNPNVTAISMSFGGGEFSGETDYDSVFTSSHITFLASTGDNGSPGAYPAYSPNVIAVGGTSLSVSSSGAFQSETGWSGSGGGTSSQEPEPAYQTSVQTTGDRTTPDVSMDADPDTGVPVYDSYDNGSSTPWITVGGTSLPCPMWAGLVAIADQGRIANGLSVFDTVSNPSANNSAEALPLLYQASKTDFHDITSGSNGGYSAAVGYDEVTGIGSPVANLLIPYLAGNVAKTSVTVGLTGSGPNPSNATQPLTFTATVSAGVPDGETVKLEDTSNNSAIIATGTLSSDTATLTVAAGTLLAGTHNLIAVYGGDANFAAGQSTVYVQTVQLVVTSVVVNGNNAALIGAQRSMVDSIVYNFSEAVMLGSNAFSIALNSTFASGTLPMLTWTALRPNTDGSSTQWAVSFSGAGVLNGSISDGVYNVTLNGSAVTSDANPTVTGTSRTDTFYRLFGDATGGGSVVGADYNALLATFNLKTTAAGYLAYFNEDGASKIDAPNYNAFLANFGMRFKNVTTITTI
jgi:subtilase family serine protease